MTDGDFSQTELCMYVCMYVNRERLTALKNRADSMSDLYERLSNMSHAVSAPTSCSTFFFPLISIMTTVLFDRLSNRTVFRFKYIKNIVRKPARFGLQHYSMPLIRE